MATETEGHLRLALLAEALPGNVILGLLPGFRQQHARIRFSVTFESQASIEAGLIADRLNFGLVDRKVNSDFLHEVECGKLEHVAVASKAYAEAHGPLDDPHKVLFVDLIDLGEHMPLARRWAEAADARTGEAKATTMLTHVKPAFVVPNFQAALSVLHRDAGVACVPKSLVESSLASGEVVKLAPSLDVPPSPLTLLYRKRTTRQLVDSLFLEYLLELAPLPVGGTG